MFDIALTLFCVNPGVISALLSFHSSPVNINGFSENIVSDFLST